MKPCRALAPHNLWRRIVINLNLQFGSDKPDTRFGLEVGRLGLSLIIRG
jgi:aspartyl-tRNA synthetase